MSNQYLRKLSLIAYGTPPVPAGTGLAVPAAPAEPFAGTVIEVTKASPTGAANQQGLELSQLRVQFKTTAMDADVPPTATIRIINLADATVQRIRKEFQGIVLQAGYEDGSFGVIFQGTIVRVKSGKLSAIDTFVDIMASNLDAIYNFGFANASVKSGSSLKQRLAAVQNSVNSSAVAQGNAGALAQGVQFGNIPNSFGTGGTLPRGKVLFGLAREHLSDAADTGGCTWSVGPDGVINFVPLTGYLPGEAVVLTSQTGLIGMPQATPQGIEINCQLNPLIKSGTRVQINNKSINTTVNKSNVGFPAYGDYQFFASTAADGFYKAIVVEHEGDSRGGGGDWLSKIIALNLDSSASPDGSVAAYG